MLRKLTPLFLIAVGGAFAQANPGLATSPVGGPPPQPYFTQLYYDGSSNLQYICKALQVQQTTKTYSVALSNLTNVVVTGSTTATITFAANSNMVNGTRIVVSGSATSTLNGTFALSSVSGTTAVFTVPSTTNATYTDMTIQTTAPLLTDNVWSVQINTYSGTTQQSAYFALPNPLIDSRSNTPTNAACSDRTKY